MNNNNMNNHNYNNNLKSSSQNITNNNKPKESTHDKLPRLDHPEMKLIPLSEEVRVTPDKVFKSIWPQHTYGDLECNQKLFRPTLRNLPRQKDLWTKMGIPVGMICQPFHELSDYEAQVQSVDIFKDDAIPRCTQCAAQINPQFIFDTNFGSFTCNLCNTTCKTPPKQCEYIQQECKFDKNCRPELKVPIQDILAPATFVMNESFKKRFVILLEKTNESVKTGMYLNVLNSIKISLEYASDAANT